MRENADTASRPLTVADALALPVLAAGQPQVVTGVDRLDRRVRWVHMTELTDPASFLKGGELVLTTGMPLPEEPAAVRRYVDELADVGAAALVGLHLFHGLYALPRSLGLLDSGARSRRRLPACLECRLLMPTS